MKKKIAIAAAAFAAIAGITAYVVWFVQDKDDVQVANVNPCSVDVSALIVKDPEMLLKTDEDITRAVFTNYFDKYKSVPECPQAGIKNHNLASIATTTRDGNHILAEITFDLEPIDLEKTEWKTPEATIDGTWVKGKKGTLSIQKYEEENSYFLVL